jgi:hypothetical protein
MTSALLDLLSLALGRGVDEIGFVLPDPLGGPSVPGCDTRFLPLCLVGSKLAIPYNVVIGIAEAASLALAEAVRAGDFTSIDRATKAALIANADHYTAWNHRKRLLLGAGPGAAGVDAELDFVDLCLSKHPKSGETWAHRGYLVRALGAAGIGGEENLGRVERELRACSRASMLHPRNYYAWAHRHVVVDLAGPAALRLDLELTLAMPNLSDYCVLHHRQVLLGLLRDGKAWTDELSRVKELLLRFPEHQSLWYHRRCLVAGTPDWMSEADRGAVASMDEEQMGLGWHAAAYAAIKTRRREDIERYKALAPHLATFLDQVME